MRRGLSGLTAGGGPSIKGRLGYSVSRPQRCCWNCACANFPYSSACSRIAAELVATKRTLASMSDGDDPAVAECGACSRWISKDVASIYKGSSSLEEARLKAAVLSDGSYVDELDNAFCEEKATPKMMEYMSRVLDEREIAGGLSPVPFDAVLEAADSAPGCDYLRFRPSRSFWLVHEWLRQNAPAYEDLMRRRQTFEPASREALKKFMVRLDAV